MFEQFFNVFQRWKVRESIEATGITLKYAYKRSKDSPSSRNLRLNRQNRSLAFRMK